MSNVRYDNRSKKPHSNLVFEKRSDGSYISVEPVHLLFDVKSDSGTPENCQLIFEIRAVEFYEFENGETEQSISLTSVMNEEVVFESKILIKSLARLKSESKRNGGQTKVTVKNVPELNLVIAVKVKDSNGSTYPASSSKGRYTWIPSEKII